MIRVILWIVGIPILIVVFLVVLRIMLAVLAGILFIGAIILSIGAIIWAGTAIIKKLSSLRRRAKKSAGAGAKATSRVEARPFAEKEQGQRREEEQKERHERRSNGHCGQKERESFGGNHYELLGVERNATQEQIRQAWQRLDYGQPLPIELRRAYANAYRILSSPDMRREYDAELGSVRREKEPKRRREEERRRRQNQEQQRRKEQEQERNRDKERRDRRARQKKSQTVPHDYYQRLGVQASATQEEIRRAWRQYAKKWHPDICKHHNATTMFQAYQEAYTVLSDPEGRRKYDSLLQGQRHQQRERQDKNANRRAEQGNGQSSYWNASRDTQNCRGPGGAKSTHQSRRGHSRRKSGRLFTGTWAKIQRGPLAGTWGVWIESLYVMEGEKAMIRRRDGHVTLVAVVQILRRSPAHRVTLCRVQNIVMP